MAEMVAAMAARTVVIVWMLAAMNFYAAMTAVEYKVPPVNLKAKAVLVALTETLVRVVAAEVMALVDKVTAPVAEVMATSLQWLR